MPGVEALALAAETGLTADDASYLWLTRSRDVELVTLVRAREDNVGQARRYPGRAGWMQPYRRWLADLSFPLAPQHIALQEYRDTIDETERRVERLTEQLRQLTPTWR